LKIYCPRLSANLFFYFGEGKRVAVLDDGTEIEIGKVVIEEQ